MMAHYGLPRTQRFLFQADNFDGALWITKDPTFLISGEELRRRTMDCQGPNVSYFR